MQVVELPNDEPKIGVEKKYISPTDNLKASCQVGTSFPAANITWFVNGKKVSETLFKYRNMMINLTFQQLYKTPFQRITYRAFEGTPTASSLELYPHSPALQEAYASALPYNNALIVSCEITIFHIYHKSLQQRIFLTDFFLTTPSSVLGWDGRRKTGDPESLTGSPASRVIGLSTILIAFSLIFNNIVYFTSILL